MRWHYDSTDFADSYNIARLGFIQKSTPPPKKKNNNEFLLGGYSWSQTPREVQIRMCIPEQLGETPENANTSEVLNETFGGEQI